MRTLHSLVAGVMFVAAVCWNTLSPLRTWILATYSFQGIEVSFVRDLTMGTFVDRKLVEGLYKHGGVQRSVPNDSTPIRFINVVIDLFQLKASTQWAKYMAPPYNDATIGDWCRTTLHLRPEVINAALDAFSTRKDNTTRFLRNNMDETKYVEDSEDCYVSEVTEALLCLMGLNSTFYVSNTRIKLEDEEYHSILQTLDQVFPDLPGCLARRQALIDASGSDNGLQQLAEELALNYSLKLRNAVGQFPVGPFKLTEGYTDLSGLPSATRIIEVTAQVTPNVWQATHTLSLRQNIIPTCDWSRQGDMNLSTCVGMLAMLLPGLQFTVPDPPTWDDFSSMDGMPSEFNVASMNTNAKQPPEFIGHVEITPHERIGSIQKYQHVPSASHNDSWEAVYLPLTTFNATAQIADFHATVNMAVLAQLSNSNVTAIDPKDVHVCWKASGLDPSADCDYTEQGVGGTSAFAQNILAMEEADSLILPERYLLFGPGLFMTDECYGIGDGKASIVIRYPRVREGGMKREERLVIDSTAEPMQILVCAIGGRLPGAYNERTDRQFSMDTYNWLLTNIVSLVRVRESFASGSEDVLLSLYALVGLIGSCLFALGYVHHVVLLASKLWRAAEREKLSCVQWLCVVWSFVSTNHSICVWEHHHSFFRVFAFLAVISWFIHGSDSRCRWDLGIDRTDDVGVIDNFDPHYICSEGTMTGVFATCSGVLRLLAVSYNVLVLVFRGPHTRGLTRSLRGLLVAYVTCGLIPTITVAFLVTWINQQRFQHEVLVKLHNQLFITALWLLCLLVLHLVHGCLVAVVAKCVLSPIGIYKQNVVNDPCLVKVLGGRSFFVPKAEYSPIATATVPLSVLLEISTFDVDEVHLVTGEYNIVGIGNADPAAKSCHCTPTCSWRPDGAFRGPRAWRAICQQAAQGLHRGQDTCANTLGHPTRRPPCPTSYIEVIVPPVALPFAEGSWTILGGRFLELVVAVANMGAFPIRVPILGIIV